jgi:acetylornithine/succinyldiaminopimelate/putrescine aminotransferase
MNPGRAMVHVAGVFPGEAESRCRVRQIWLLSQLQPQDARHHDRLAAALEVIIHAMGDTIGFCPPLIITASEIDEILDLFARTLSSLEQDVTRQTGMAAE